ncbi:MAG: hypothetical protein ACYC77_04075 [Coriobacteriia bacterium]
MKTVKVLWLAIFVLMMSPGIAHAAWLPAYNYGVNWSPWPAGFIDASDAGETACWWQQTGDYDPVQYDYVWASAVSNNIPNLVILNTQTHGAPCYQVYFYTPGRLQADGTTEFVSCLRADRSSPPSQHEHTHRFSRLDNSIWTAQCNHYRYISDLPATNLRIALLGSCQSAVRPAAGGDGLLDELRNKGADCSIGFNDNLNDVVAYGDSLRFYFHYGFWSSLHAGDLASEAVLDGEAFVYQRFGYYGNWTNNVLRGVDRRL